MHPSQALGHCRPDAQPVGPCSTDYRLGLDSGRNDALWEMRTMAGNLNEEQLAEYFQAHKDDEEEWEPAPPPSRRKSKELSVNMSIRFTAAEAVAIQQEATRLGLSSSELVRRAVQHLVRPVELGDQAKTA